MLGKQKFVKVSDSKNFTREDNPTAIEADPASMKERKSIFTPKAFTDKDEMRICSKNILLTDTNNLTQQQVESAMKKLICAAKLICSDLIERFRVNTVFFPSKQPGGKKEPSGYSYIYVADQRFFNLLMGLNLNGSERCQKMYDPDWSPPPVRKMASFYKADGVTRRSWYYVDVEQKKYDREYFGPKIKIKLPPLLDFNDRKFAVKLTEEQIQYLAERNIHTTEHLLQFSSAHIGTETDKSCIYTLFCKNVPTHVTEKQIKDIFYPDYVSNAVEQGNVYPIVEIKKLPENKNDPQKRGPRQCAYVKFSKLTQDARFALLMTRQYVLDERTTLFFELYNSNQNKY